jgi:hypothetical protein
MKLFLICAVSRIHTNEKGKMLPTRSNIFMSTNAVPVLPENLIGGAYNLIG